MRAATRRVTLDGAADGNHPASDDSVVAAKFRGSERTARFLTHFTAGFRKVPERLLTLVVLMKARLSHLTSSTCARSGPFRSTSISPQ
jgi:hypothetical protein